ncbi:MAG: putative toxin-antitoxin system toxin component, PIN family, partial [Cyclobacteriaceae bacterium]
MIFIFDTNALISAHLLKTSVNAEALKKALRIGKFVFSDVTFKEFAEVLYRKKLDKYFVEGEREEILSALTFKSSNLDPFVEIKVCRDPKVDMFLELAVSAKASCIITGDPHLLELHPAYRQAISGNSHP